MYKYACTINTLYLKHLVFIYCIVCCAVTGHRSSRILPIIIIFVEIFSHTLSIKLLDN